MDYQKLYMLLFNGVTDALRELDALNIGQARRILVEAQQHAEGRYLEEAE